MIWIWTGLRYCGQALLMAVFGRVIGGFADHAMKTPELIGFGRFRVKFVCPDKTIKEAKFPFQWMATLYCTLQERRYRVRSSHVVYKSKHGSVVC